MVRKFDFLVIGSGIAGMSYALKVAHKGKVALICKAGLEEANTYYAQGGIASVTDLKVDNFEMTLKEISHVLEVSESRVSQLHTKALKKMRVVMGEYMDILLR